MGLARGFGGKREQHLFLTALFGMAPAVAGHPRARSSPEKSAVESSPKDISLRRVRSRRVSASERTIDLLHANSLDWIEVPAMDPTREQVMPMYDPRTGQVAWQYRPPEGEQLFTNSGGAAQRLPNGNTLITETNRGRAFEVTPEGESVWEFYNPFLDPRERAGSSSAWAATASSRYRPCCAARTQSRRFAQALDRGNHGGHGREDPGV